MALLPSAKMDARQLLTQERHDHGAGSRGAGAAESHRSHTTAEGRGEEHSC